MIAYEDLVAALKSWRARNGLPNTPPDYGDSGPVASYGDAQSGATPDEIYDLSDDSGLIVAEDLQGSNAEYAGEYQGEAYEGDAYQGYGDEQRVGAIETGVEISAEGEAPEASDYDNPPGTDAYGYTSGEYDDAAQSDQYAAASAFEGEEAATGSYEDPPAQQYGEYAEPGYGDDMYGSEGTLEADAEDVVDEMDADQAEVLPGAYDDLGEDDAAMFAGDESIDEATVVASEPNDLEPDALPEPPEEPDR